MSSPLRVRLMTRGDLPFADSVRAQAGWNQTLIDWERFLALEPDGCFLAEWNGAPAYELSERTALPLPVRNERGEGRREGHSTAHATTHLQARRPSSPHPSPLSAGGEGEESGALNRNTPAGTATTTVYGPELGWIGMMLVHPDHRRRGIGRALLERCIEYLRGRGVRCIKLDATPVGKKLYDGLGFADEWPLTRWEHVGLDPGRAMIDPRVRPWREADVRMIDPFDSIAFGVSRQRLVRALAQQSRCALVLESEPDRIEGYGLLRSGSCALYLGPVVAVSEDTAHRLIQALLAHGRGEKIFWDIPDQNIAAVEWARAHDFTPQRSLTRMYLVENTTSGDAKKQFALAGPEFG